MNNYELRKGSLDEISKDLFKQGIFLSYKDGVTSSAPLGFSGDTIILHSNKAEGERGRSSEVSLRNHCGDTELLITGAAGSFLFHGKMRIDLGLDFVVDNYWNIFLLLKDSILLTHERTSQFKDQVIPKDVDRTIGYEMLASYVQRNQQNIIAPKSESFIKRIYNKYFKN